VSGACHILREIEIVDPRRARRLGDRGGELVGSGREHGIFAAQELSETLPIAEIEGLSGNCRGDDGVVEHGMILVGNRDPVVAAGCEKIRNDYANSARAEYRHVQHDPTAFPAPEDAEGCGGPLQDAMAESTYSTCVFGDLKG
jgi:hypothetical protein